MKFIKIGNVILNVGQIESVNLNQVHASTNYESDNDPFGATKYEIKGIRVHIIGYSECNYFVFEDETIDSFFEKINPVVLQGE